MCFFNSALGALRLIPSNDDLYLNMWVDITYISCSVMMSYTLTKVVIMHLFFTFPLKTKKLPPKL